MNGGSYEYVMANYGKSFLTDKFTSIPEQKYYNNYTSNVLSTACNGLTCPGVGWSNETGNGLVDGQNNWYNDYMAFPTSSAPWVIRGGGITDYTTFDSSYGILYSSGHSYDGNSGGHGDYTFRIVAN